MTVKQSEWVAQLVDATRLTKREAEVWTCVKTGQCVDEVADRLGIPEGNVTVHFRLAESKLNKVRESFMLAFGPKELYDELDEHPEMKRDIMARIHPTRSLCGPIDAEGVDGSAAGDTTGAEAGLSGE